MKKALLLLASAALGTAAIAQTPPSTTGTMPAPMTGTMPADQSTMPAPAMAPTDQSAMPAPAMAPSGQGMMTPGAAPMAQPASGDYPVCSRTVTDHCMQHGSGMMMHHHMMKKK